MKSTYEIRRYRNQDSPDLAKALKLYSDNIEPEYRTDTREIQYWLNRFEKKFGDSFFVLGLYLNDILIGYTQMAYFKEERFVELDYLVIDKNFRKNNSFYEFVSQIGDFLSSQNITFDYIICEVGCYFENKEPTENSKTLIRLLKMSRFGVIKCAYYIPRLGKQNFESQMRAILMIYTNDELKQIKKETYLMIIKTILYKYYQRWYFDFFNETEKKEYKVVLDDLFEKIKTDAERRMTIEINGYHNLLPLNPTDFNEIKVKKGIKILAYFLVFIIAIICFGSLALLIRDKIKLEVSEQASILILGVITASTITSWLIEKKSNLGKLLVEKLIDKL